MADLDSSEVRQRTSDIREWIFEAVDKIGAPMQYIRKESGTDGMPLLPIQDNQVPLPEDLVVLDGVAYSHGINGPWVPMSTMTGVFREPRKFHGMPQAHLHTSVPHDPENKAIDDYHFMIPDHQPPAHKLMTAQAQFYGVNTVNHLDHMYRDRVHEKPEYFIKPGWLVTNKKKGFIKLSYKAIATDERGYPLIPDLTSYQEAIYWYVVMKLSFPKWLNGQLGGSSKYAQKYAANTYFYTQQQWNFYRNQAYAEAMMPTADDMQNIKNDWNKLIPDWDGDDTFFKNINKEELTYNDYYHGY